MINDRLTQKDALAYTDAGHMTLKDYIDLTIKKHWHLLHRRRECDEEECMVCEGGLALCTTCGGAEASMPTECPGRKMTADESDNVQAGNIDYRNGRFVCTPCNDEGTE